jgi:HK97 gp10 family phage protein
MKATLTLEIKKNDFEKLAKQLPNKTSVVVRKTAMDILAYSVPETPIDTGFLRNSASVSYNATQASVHWAAEYAIYQEFGTRYFEGKLFATHAVAKVEPLFVEAMKQLLESLE